ncbi:MAG: ribonuclease III [Ruminococcaceae bacterium]|nr:ribonuclease III [Oscillospiraceae bacterium]
MKKDTNKDYLFTEELEKILSYKFRDKSILIEALTHSSYSNENPGADKNNERLEFLGDSILSYVVTEYLFLNKKEFPEGELTRARALIVREETLSKFASKLNLGKYILLGRGERLSKGYERPSILADLFEAVIAAVYLDGGIGPAKRLILDCVSEFENGDYKLKNYKTELQELVQRVPDKKLSYSVVDESGPDHEKSFTVEVSLDGVTIGAGKGQSKKAAEQQAAKQALLYLEL